MNNQNNLQFNESVRSLSNIWKIIVSVVITALVVGGGVYAWQRSGFKSAEQNLQQQIANLQSQLEDLRLAQPNQGQQENGNNLITGENRDQQVNQNINQTNSLTPEQKSAEEKCKTLNGESRLADSMLYGEKQIFCSFGILGECTQGELNDGTCFEKTD